MTIKGCWRRRVDLIGWSAGLLLFLVTIAERCHSFTSIGFPQSPADTRRKHQRQRKLCLSIFSRKKHHTVLSLSDNPIIQFINVDDDDDDDDDEEEDDDEEDDGEEDPYTQAASSEFLDSEAQSSGGLVPSSASPSSSSNMPTTDLDWGGALGNLRKRVEDVESGKSQNPSQALFRLLSSQAPNQAIGSFVQSADPQVVDAMSGAIGSLLGGLSNPMTGVEITVKASGERVGALCFQLQMTGYMFRNAEYVMALKDLMNLRGSTSLQDYRDAFERLDSDNSGYIESAEVKELLDDVYDGKTPAFEVNAFLKFFDQNNDGRISWEEFERGLGAAMAHKTTGPASPSLPVPEGDEDDEYIFPMEPDVTGTIEVEMENGKIVEVDAKDYMEQLKSEAQSLREALQREKMGAPSDDSSGSTNSPPPMDSDNLGSIATYIASRQGDLKSLTEGINPEIVETMKLLVDFVLDGSSNGRMGEKKEEMEMEIPGTALQQLALWQLVLGYRLREAEAKGDYLKLLE